MNTHVGSWVLHRKWILAAVGLPILVAAWWAFRPEKLWINQKVSEPAPFASSTDPQPLYTGRLEGKAHQTTGRATIYKTPDGKQYLRLTDFSTSNGPDVHVTRFPQREPRRSELRSSGVCRFTEIQRGRYLLRAIPYRIRFGAARTVPMKHVHFKSNNRQSSTQLFDVKNAIV